MQYGVAWCWGSGAVFQQLRRNWRRKCEYTSLCCFRLSNWNTLNFTPVTVDHHPWYLSTLRRFLPFCRMSTRCMVSFKMQPTFGLMSARLKAACTHWGCDNNTDPLAENSCCYSSYCNQHRARHIRLFEIIIYLNLIWKPKCTTKCLIPWPSLSTSLSMAVFQSDSHSWCPGLDYRGRDGKNNSANKRCFLELKRYVSPYIWPSVW